jgi:Mrp family chromosome partitioning ATPase
MDIDICGPSAPRIMGVEGETGKKWKREVVISYQ